MSSLQGCPITCLLRIRIAHDAATKTSSVRIQIRSRCKLILHLPQGTLPRPDALSPWNRGSVVPEQEGAAAPKSVSVCSVLVSVVVPDPGLRVWKVLLIAALGNQVEVLIGGVHHVDAARKAGIGMKHRAALVFIECANPLTVQGAG